MSTRVENKKYFVEQIHSTKANKMTALYHYSGVGFKKAVVNLGVFRQEDQKMVGVLQWGCSYQEGIRLDRYVKEPISKSEYLELNRFSMADSEGKNSESQAISLGMKWIKINMPHIRLLVSYAGRKEGNYGYIYQATNWEYLGYFISEGFWFVDGEERHLSTLWSRYVHHGNQELSFLDALKEMYKDLRKTWTKQFIYIQRLDKKLTPASELLPYPKPSNEFPIKTREVIYKKDDEIFNNYKPQDRVEVEYFYEKERSLFCRATLKRRGEELPGRLQMKIAVYNDRGELERTGEGVKSLVDDKYKDNGIRDSIKTGKIYKDCYFRSYEDEPEEEIEIHPICMVDEIPFVNLAEMGRYLGVTRQAASIARKRKTKKVGGIEVTWY